MGEALLQRERKEAHERLRSSCAELTAHLNELRCELVEQRRAAELLETRAIPKLREDLETQIAELGGALASRMHASVSSTSKGMEARLEEFSRILGQRAEHHQQQHSWHHDSAELSCRIQELVRHESAQTLDAAREEARTVHLEVMGVDTRVAAIEERLADEDLQSMRRQTRLAEQKSPVACVFAAPEKPPLSKAA